MDEPERDSKHAAMKNEIYEHFDSKSHAKKSIYLLQRFATAA